MTCRSAAVAFAHGALASVALYGLSDRLLVLEHADGLQFGLCQLVAENLTPLHVTLRAHRKVVSRATLP